MLRIVSVQFLPPELPELGHRGAIGGLLVSISAAIGEEVWLRLGVMTILAWLFLRLLGQSELRPQVHVPPSLTATCQLRALSLKAGRNTYIWPTTDGRFP
jgi:hypothetical protein